MGHITYVMFQSLGIYSPISLDGSEWVTTVHSSTSFQQSYSFLWIDIIGQEVQVFLESTNVEHDLLP